MGRIKLEAVPVDKDLNTLIKLDPAFPFIVYHDDLQEFTGGFVNWHKQTSLEIAVVLEGSLDVSVLEQEETMCVGDAFLILPERLHTVKPNPHHTAAKYYTLVFEPELLTGFKGSFFDRQYYTPALGRSETFFKFDTSQPWSQPVFDMLAWIYERFPDESPGFELAVQRRVQDIWLLLWEHLLSQVKEGAPQQHNTRILDMIEYLHTHYAAKFSLADMAAHSNISRGECCRFFKKMMHTTISEYLAEYRLAKALELLETTHLTITEISETVGFSSPSYFIQTFRQKTGYTPLAYRNLLGRQS